VQPDEMPTMVFVLVGVAVALALLGVLAVTAALAQISDLPFPEQAGRESDRGVSAGHERATVPARR
jgi:hypothetical protein